jgi:hypothetical protein
MAEGRDRNSSELDSAAGRAEKPEGGATRRQVGRLALAALIAGALAPLASGGRGVGPADDSCGDENSCPPPAAGNVCTGFDPNTCATKNTCSKNECQVNLSNKCTSVNSCEGKGAVNNCIGSQANDCGSGATNSCKAGSTNTCSGSGDVTGNSCSGSGTTNQCIGTGSNTCRGSYNECTSSANNYCMQGNSCWPLGGDNATNPPL